VDINCDLGEGFGSYSYGDDAELLRWVTSANVACGFHAGDPRVMARTVEAAKSAGVTVGAHPGFPDLAGFGRRNMALTPEEIRTDVLYQIGALAAFCRASGVPLQHVKPHGQLNNMAVVDRVIADAVVTAIAQFDRSLILVAYGGELLAAGVDSGLTVAREAYADRRYLESGLLAPRSQPDAVIHNPADVARNALEIAQTGSVATVAGQRLSVDVHTICIHGDTPGAAEAARQTRRLLEHEGVTVRPMGKLFR
jgi:UPF0271 protein